MRLEVDLHKGSPFGLRWLSDQFHVGFPRRSIRFFCIAGDAGANDVFPVSRPAFFARDDVV